MNKVYDILLDQVKIGTTQLESADESMGVVFGRITFQNIASGYEFFREYCLMNRISFEDFAENKLITTQIIPNLSVFEKSGYEIKGNSCSISGMDGDCFEICIEGIPYPFYQEEFQHHVKVNKKRLK